MSNKVVSFLTHAKEQEGRGSGDQMEKTRTGFCDEIKIFFSYLNPVNKCPSQIVSYSAGKRGSKRRGNNMFKVPQIKR